MIQVISAIAEITQVRWNQGLIFIAVWMVFFIVDPFPDELPVADSPSMRGDCPDPLAPRSFAGRIRASKPCDMNGRGAETSWQETKAGRSQMSVFTRLASLQ